jgi:hypothetical protein
MLSQFDFRVIGRYIVELHLPRWVPTWTFSEVRLTAWVRLGGLLCQGARKAFAAAARLIAGFFWKLRKRVQPQTKRWGSGPLFEPNLPDRLSLIKRPSDGILEAGRLCSLSVSSLGC